MNKTNLIAVVAGLVAFSAATSQAEMVCINQGEGQHPICIEKYPALPGDPGGSGGGGGGGGAPGHGTGLPPAVPPDFVCVIDPAACQPVAGPGDLPNQMTAGAAVSSVSGRSGSSLSGDSGRRP